MTLGSAARTPSRSMSTGCTTESSQLPSQVTRASMSPSVLPPRQAADGWARAKTTCAAVLAPAEWPKTIIVSGSPPYSAARARANSTAQAPWELTASVPSNVDAPKRSPPAPGPRTR